jgi:CARDB
VSSRAEGSAVAEGVPWPGATFPHNRARPRRARARTGWAIAVAALLLVTMAAGANALSGRQTIGFEEIAPPPGQGIAVSDQYAGRGIVFEGPTALDFSGSGLADGRVAIQMCWAKEFCEDDLQIALTGPATHIGLRFGLANRLAGDGTVVLEAFDADGGLRGEADAALTEGEGPVPARAVLFVDDPDGAIIRATVRTEDVPIGLLLFDDVELDAYQAPAPMAQLALTGAVAVAEQQTVTVTAIVANLGDAPSAPSRVEVGADGWPPASTALPGIEPGDEVTVSLELPIPAEARGTSTVFDVLVDPAGESGDADPSDNEGRVAADIGGQPEPPEVTAPPVEAPPEASPEGEGEVPTETPPPVDGLTLVLLGGLVVLVVGGSAVVIHARGRTPGGGSVDTSITLDPGKQAELELSAENADPPDTCSRDGAWYCKWSATFDPRARHLASLEASGTREGRSLATTWPDDVRDRVRDAVRHAEDPRGAGAGRLAEVAAELARSVPGSPASPTERLSVTAHVTGSSGTGTFTPYRCRVRDGQGHYERFGREWKKTVTEQLDRSLAQVDPFDGTPGAVATLASALEAGLNRLAKDM